MKTSTKIFSASTTLLTVIALASPMVALAATPSPVGTATDDTLTTTTQAQFGAGYLTIDGATNYNFTPNGAQAISSTALSLPTTPSKDTLTLGTLGTTGTVNDNVDVNGSAVTITAMTSPLAAPTADGVQVTDNRGSNAGWSLYAYSTDLYNGSYDLKGSTITLGAGSDTNLAPVTPASVTGGALLTGTGTASVTDNAGTTHLLNPAVQVATAAAGSSTAGTFSGTGTNALAFGSVTLNVPAGIAQIGTYSGNIVWDLTTAP
ncbi:WxL domain-containing protein [Lactococcus sp.]|uniref:WxL domain-containing protein n=1 Tax=Lactococcus sp. TaxID=44273 RepID=UPI0035B4CCD1